MEAPQSIVKVMVVGDYNTGKSCIVQRIADDVFSEAYVTTIGVDFRILKDDESNTKFQIWDTAGKERFRSITKTYYRGSNIVMVVYSVADRSTFESIES